MLALVLDALAAYRLTRLVTADVLADGPRETWVEAAYTAEGRAEEVRADAEATSWSEVAQAEGHGAPKLATLVTCRWCAGFWISAGVVAARRAAPRAWDPLARVLAFSAGAALLARLEDG